MIHLNSLEGTMNDRPLKTLNKHPGLLADVETIKSNHTKIGET